MSVPGRGRIVAGFAVATGLLAMICLAIVSPAIRSAPPPRVIAGEPGPDPTTRLRTADAANGARIFGRCAACHSIGRGSPDLDGPNLYGVVGAKVAGRRQRFAYTAALRRLGGTWDFKTLDAWLESPKRVAPGTSMAFEGLADRRERADVIAYLNLQGSNLPLP